MTIEEKARAYDEALKWMRELYPGLHGATKEDAEHYFPELRESEDERIRKALVWHLKADVDFVSNGVTKAECIAYLEKQKEQKPEVDESTKRLNKNWMKQYFDEQQEQKPAEWSEEDADMLNCCISSIEEAKENRYAYKETDGDTSYDREIDWLKSLRPSWKPSEEQMRSLEYFIELWGDSDGQLKYAKIFNDVKSLYEQLKKL